MSDKSCETCGEPIGDNCHFHDIKIAPSKDEIISTLAKALQFYADEGNWEWQDEDTPFSSPVLNDEGKLARQTLRECGIEPSAPRS